MSLALPPVKVIRRSLERSLGTAYWSPLIGITLEEDPLVDRWLRALVLVEGRSEKTTKSYAEWLVPVIKYRVALGLSWADLTDHLEDLFRWRRDDYRPRSKGPGSLGPSREAMKYMRIALTGAYRYGFANGLVDPVLRPRVLEMNTTPRRRPAGAASWEANQECEVMRIKVRRGSDAADKAVRRRREQVPHAADEEFVAVLNATRSARDRCLLAWLRAPGLRVGQAVTLKRDRVHLGAFQECVSARLGGHVHVEPVTDHPQQAGVKVADPIALPLGSFGVDAYREWLGERAGIREARLSPWLFVTLPGGPVPAGQALSTQGVRSMLAEACKRAGVRILRPHMLRHSAGQTGADLNLAPDLLQRILGHRSITSQGVYRRVSDTRAEAAVQSLESFRSRVEQQA